jgi:hypothetical protein
MKPDTHRFGNWSQGFCDLISWWMIELPVDHSYLVAIEGIRFGVQVAEPIFVERHTSFPKFGPRT